MGDRGNVCVIAHGKKVGKPGRQFLYTHNLGTKLPGILRRALARSEERWDDDGYLGRIIHAQMIIDSGPNIQETLLSLTGFGISPYLLDYNHDTLVVNTKTKMVGLSEPGSEYEVRDTIPFDVFAKSDIETMDDYRNFITKQRQAAKEAKSHKKGSEDATAGGGAPVPEAEAKAAEKGA